MKVIAETERAERVKESEGNLYALERLLNLARSEGPLKWPGFIDPYADTVLNQLQLVDLLVEWTQLSRLADSEEEREALAKVREMAEFCLAESNLYLRFYGD